MVDGVQACFQAISAKQQTGKLEFARRAGGQVVRKICVGVSALRRSVSFYGSLANWNLAHRQNVSFR